MEIYIADITPLQSKELYFSLLEKIPVMRQESIGRCKKAGDKHRSLGAGLLLEYGLNRRGMTLLPDVGFEQVFLERGENGKPAFKGREDCCFNLSHSGDYVAAVFDSAPVGIDIEKIKNDGTKIVKRFFCEKEQQCFAKVDYAEDKKTRFTELWTRKESYIKAEGGGMKIPLDSFCVLEDRMEEPEKYFFRTFFAIEGYCLSVCAKNRIDTVPVWVGLSDIKDSMESYSGTGI